MMLVDGDILVYTVGYTCETRWYEVECEDTQSIVRLASKRDVKEHYPHIDADTLEMMREAEPTYFVTRVVDEVMRSWMSKLGRHTFKVFLTDTNLKNNFRYKLCPEYKANRKGGTKPIHYEFIREYLQDKYEAEVVSGIEADDALGMAQTKHTVIVSKDKDLLQIPGDHYNITTGKIVHATDTGGLNLWKDKAGKTRLTGHGFKWFCAQMLLGDDIDNIKGINRVGAVRTHKELAPLRTKEKMWEKVKSIYTSAKRDDVMVNAQLLWILRKPNQSFTEELCK